MSPSELAAKHPRLYHVTKPEAMAGIQKNGLLSASRLMKLFELSDAQRQSFETQIRPISVDLHHPTHGRARLTDNLQLTATPLAECLDDGLNPADWLRMLNDRVFFWVSEKDVDAHLRAGTRPNSRLVLILDTFSVAQQHLHQIDLAAINTGSTARRVARRGCNTFAPAQQHTYRQWQALRGGHDVVRELTVREGVYGIEKHLVGYYGFPHLDRQTKRAMAAID